MDISIAPYELTEREGLTVFHFAEDRSSAERIAREFLRAVNQYTEWFGPMHDFRGLTIIEVPTGYGSQADAATILLQASGFEDPDNPTQLYHEASHLWNVELAERPSPRWDEGLATFHEVLLVDVFARDNEYRAVEAQADRIRRSWCGSSKTRRGSERFHRSSMAMKMSPT